VNDDDVLGRGPSFTALQGKMEISWDAVLTVDFINRRPKADNRNIPLI
jgi:hypothetical protein